MTKLDMKTLTETGIGVKAMESLRDLARFNIWNTDTMTWYDCETNVFWYEEVRPDWEW